MTGKSPNMAALCCCCWPQLSHPNSNLQCWGTPWTASIKHGNFGPPRMEAGSPWAAGMGLQMLRMQANGREFRLGEFRLAGNTGRNFAKCDPYFDQTGCGHPGCEPAYPTPRCVKKCHVKNLLWAENKRFSVNAYRINNDVHDIMAEIYENGPVEVAFTVYEDFAHYKSGVYRHITGDALGGHAVKLIGWGTSEQGEDYWLLANQWNRDWGDDGYFKILRGTNECEIEEDVVAGLPSGKNLIKNFVEMDAATDASA
ncbi:hypothetical protein KFK09_012976 [Dendrobium nobile]|uniref:Peptidase C1A papain C-terminal domain-containing protein n=1 Tax=Dendrobium nobile TaxID=94219 RepID=A0A8T3BJA7_DENNO|nr:hypothetical protein KFK09_012976 [Dendrobium nobile]